MRGNSSRFGRSVVITGVGVLAANGIGKESFWKTLIKGESGIDSITLFDASELKSQIAGEVKGFDATAYVPAHMKPRRMSRATQFALAGTNMALKDAQLDKASLSEWAPIPVMVGSSIMDLDMLIQSSITMKKKGPRFGNPNIVFNSAHQSVAGAIAEFLGVKTSGISIATACAAGLDAIGSAYRLIQQGEADIVVAGGSEAPISMTPMAELTLAGLSSTCNDTPRKASRPFDQKRDSGVIAEGAGIVVLETLETALARNRTPYAFITGYATCMDNDRTRAGSGFVESMSLALSHAGRAPQDVDYVSAWGPGHPTIDQVETDAIKELFGDAAYSIPISSIKGVIGNPLGASGAIQVVAAALTCASGMIPPTANYEYLDPLCDLDYVPGAARKAQVTCALINAHGVGGGNSSLVIEPYLLESRDT